MDDTLVASGGEVKALGDGMLGGYLVLFGTPETPDISQHRDFFDAKTDFGPHTKSATFYHHGMDPKLGVKRFAHMAETGADDVGVWVKQQIDTRDAYERAVYQLAAAGKLGWSSGTAAHLVRRTPIQTPNGGTANHLDTWILGVDASLTPTPADPRNAVVMAAKALPAVPTFEELLASVAGAMPEAESTAAEPDAEAKMGMMDKPLMQAESGKPPTSEHEMGMAAFRALSNRLEWRMSDCMRADEPMGERMKKCGELLQEFHDKAGRAMGAIMAGETKSLEEAFKGILSGGLLDGLSLEAHSACALAALDEWTRRLEEVLALRAAQKAGRVLSQANREHLEAVCTKLQALHGEMRELLDKTGLKTPEGGEQQDVVRAAIERMRAMHLRDQAVRAGWLKPAPARG